MSLAIDLAPRGITVNNVQPGPTETDMTVAHAEMVKPLVPLGRLGKPEETPGLGNSYVELHARSGADGRFAAEPDLLQMLL